MFTQVIRYSNYCGLGDCGMCLQGGFNFTGGDVFARTANDVLVTVDKVEHAVLILADRIASVEPVTSPRLGRCLLIFVVGREKAAAGVISTVPYQQFTGVTYGNILVLFVHDTGFKPIHRFTEGTCADLPGWVVVGKYPTGFRHAPDFHHRKAESSFRDCVMIRIDTGTDPEANAVIRFCIANWKVHQ